MVGGSWTSVDVAKGNSVNLWWVARQLFGICISRMDVSFLNPLEIPSNLLPKLGLLQKLESDAAGLWVPKWRICCLIC